MGRLGYYLSLALLLAVTWGFGFLITVLATL